MFQKLFCYMDYTIFFPVSIWSSRNKGSILWEMMPLAIVWCVQKERIEEVLKAEDSHGVDGGKD